MQRGVERPDPDEPARAGGAPQLELVDLHNHTDRSYDASNRLEDYERAHAAGRFHVLALTDHNRIDGAVWVRERASFPVVVGIELDTAEGELIGLFVEDRIPPGLPARITAERIRDQGGLVYLPHPFYPLVRRPLRASVRDGLADLGLVDVVEGRNGGPFTDRPDAAARRWAGARGLSVGAGSDAHDPVDIGRCVVALPPGPLEPAALVERLRQGRIVDRRRPSSLQLATKARYRVFAEIPRRVRGGPRRRRLP
jgi:predicted metal-dependent phosphoesterase TrpH